MSHQPNKKCNIFKEHVMILYIALAYTLGMAVAFLVTSYCDWIEWVACKQEEERLNLTIKELEFQIGVLTKSKLIKKEESSDKKGE